jgi:AcrR family transcriptional regulator
LSIKVNPGIQKRKKGIETANRILEISAELFAQKGYDAVSVREISQAAGIKESSLYNHFSSKANILEVLFDGFVKMTPESRPSEAELDRMMAIMRPEEIFKNIVFHVGSHMSETLANTARIIHYEKFRNPAAAQMYYKYMVKEPCEYYERLINRMTERGMIRSVDAYTVAEQYNYVSLALTEEYFMAKNGLVDMDTVVRNMVKTLEFFCGFLQKTDIS